MAIVVCILVFGVWCLVFGVWYFVFGVFNFQTSNLKHQIQNTKYKIPNTKHKTQNTKYQTQNTKHKKKGGSYEIRTFSKGLWYKFHTTVGGVSAAGSLSAAIVGDCCHGGRGAIRFDN
ncbi:hypothetical protein QUF72_07000 [Desulfobacterales bacterium HSG2]|nr:hypothetical protein [Desulfobacterales bacterium HSG2]